MAQLNGITVRFSDGIKTADYAPPRLYDITANVVLDTNDDFETVVATTMSAIQHAGYTALHGRPPETAIAGAERAITAEEQSSGEVPARRTRGPAKSKAATSAETLVPAGTAELPEGAVVIEPSEDEWAAGADDIVITDAELLSASSKRAGELGAREPIVKLIATFATRTEGAPFKVQEIPANQRKDYLTKLTALAA